MKSFTLLCAITLIAFAIAPVVRGQDNSAIETKLKQMEDAWEKAYLDKDSAALSSMIADDFAGVNSEGKQRNKSQLLAEMKSETDTLNSATNDNMQVHVYGPNVATVVGTSMEKGKEKNGKEFSHSFAWVDVWMERNGKWECISEGVTVIPKKR